jgi:hypothetical protein
MGCSPASKIPSAEIRSDKIVSSSPGPGWVWDPKYYVYNGKHYRFVRGHYRKVLSRKNYFKKSLQGYTSKQRRQPNKS